MSDGNPDVMDTLAGIADGSPLAALRAARPDVVKHLQGSDDAIFAPAHHGGLTRPEREACAMRGASLLRGSVPEGHHHPPAGARGERILAHVDRVTMDPADAAKADIDALLAAGLTPHAVVSLSQLIAYVNFQSRVLAGLRMLKGAA